MKINAIVVSATFAVMAGVSGVIEAAPAKKVSPARPQLALQYGHSFHATCIAYAPDGRFFVSVVSQETGLWSEVKIWDAATGGLWWNLTGPTADITQVAFAGGGRWLVTGGTGGTIRLWDAASGRLLYSFPKIENANILSLSVSPDGRRLAAGMLMNPTGKAGTPDQPGAILAPRGRNLVGFPHEIRFWDLASRQAIGAVVWPDTATIDVAFDGSGKRLAAASTNEVRVLNVATLRWEQKFPVDKASFSSVTWSRDGKWLAAGGSGQVRLWPMKAKGTMRLLPVKDASSIEIEFSPDGKTLIGATDDLNSSHRVVWWDVASGRELRSVGSDTEQEIPERVAFSPDGHRLAVAGSFGVLSVWNAQTGKVIRGRLNPGGDVNHATFSPDSQYLVSGNEDGTLRWWNLRTGRLDRTVNKSAGDIAGVAFTKDGSHIYSLGWRDKKLQGWKVNGGKLQPVLTRDVPNSDVVAVNVDNSLLATLGGEEKSVRIWNAHTGKLVQYITGHGERVTGASFTPHQELFISCSVDGTVKFWDIKEGVCVRTLRLGEAVTTMVLHPNGKLLVGAGSTGKIRVWNFVSGRVLHDLNGHSGAIGALAFNTAGQLVSVSADGSVRRWDLTTGRCLDRRVLQAPGRECALSADGELVAAIVDRGVVQVSEARTGRALVGFGLLPFVPAQLDYLEDDSLEEPVSANWVAFNAAGYYMAPSGAEPYIWWRDGEVLKPARALASTYRRPDLVARGLKEYWSGRGGR